MANVQIIGLLMVYFASFIYCESSGDYDDDDEDGRCPNCKPAWSAQCVFGITKDVYQCCDVCALGPGAYCSEGLCGAGLVCVQGYEEGLTAEELRDYPSFCEVAPTSETPTTTEAPTSTDAPTTEAPTSGMPTAEATTTKAPSTEGKTTAAPTTPTTTEATEVPTNEQTTTEASSPPTVASTTEAPITFPRVYLSLKGVVYANNSVIPIREVGETSRTGLQCITDRRPCCAGARIGQWRFPDGTLVPVLGAGATLFYRNRGEDGTVNLNRLYTGVMMPTGLFCCEVPDAIDVDQTVCIHIVNIMITSSTTGTPTAGETYSLDCSVSGTSNPATYQWFDNNGTELANTTQLQFSPLRASEAGMYTCRATVEGMVVMERNATVDINFPADAIQVSVERSGISIAGEMYTLTCNVSAISGLMNSPSAVWTDGTMNISDGSGVTVSTTTASSYSISVLTFDPLKTSHGGEYTCVGAVGSPALYSPQTDSMEETVTVQISFLNVGVPNTPDNPYNGTNFTITGVVSLHPSVDTNVTVTGTWSGDNAPQETSVPPYQIHLPFLPAATDRSGEYTLTVSVRPTDNSPLIISNSHNTTYNLVIKPLPSRPPTISIVFRRELDGYGEVMTLNCTANQVENLFSPPTIVWIAPDGSEVPTVESNNRRMIPQTGQLIFSDVTPNNRGQYTCRAVVNIPQAQIDSYIDASTVQVNTNRMHTDAVTPTSRTTPTPPLSESQRNLDLHFIVVIGIFVVAGVVLVGVVIVVICYCCITRQWSSRRNREVGMECKGPLPQGNPQTSYSTTRV